MAYRGTERRKKRGTKTAEGQKRKKRRDKEMLPKNQPIRPFHQLSSSLNFLDFQNIGTVEFLTNFG